MRVKQSIVAAVMVVGSGATAILGSGQGGQLPLEPTRERGLSITGAYEGWYKNADGTSTLLVGYFNRNSKESLDIPIGPNNRIEPGGPDQGQPTHFRPGRGWGVFSITVPRDFGNKRLTWTLVANGETTTVPVSLNSQYEITPFKDLAMGNTPPTVKFSATGPAVTGPPRGIAATYAATTTQPATFEFWVADEGGKEGGFGRGGPGASVFLSKFRGPGDIKFSAERPTVSKADGRVSATAAFSAPGDYVVRVQVNDSSGDGGGGFQCCWTNAHVKVTVK